MRNGNSAFHIDNRPNLYFPIYVSAKVDENGIHKITLNKSESIAETFPPKFGTGIQGVWRWGQEKVKNEIDDLGAKIIKKEFHIYQKRRKNTVMLKNYLNEKELYTVKGRLELEKLKLDFSFPKPEKLLKYLMEVSTKEKDIVLDFFIGSGTTAAVAHKMKRQYIGVEQMSYIKNITVERIKKVIEGENGGISNTVNWRGGGSFIYLELKKLNQQFVEEIQKANNKEKLIKIRNEIIDKSFINYNVNIEEIKSNEKEFKMLGISEMKNILYLLLDKNQLYVNHSSLNDEDFECTDEEKRITKEFYR